MRQETDTDIMILQKIRETASELAMHLENFSIYKILDKISSGKLPFPSKEEAREYIEILRANSLHQEAEVFQTNYFHISKQRVLQEEIARTHPPFDFDFDFDFEVTP